MQQKAQRRRSRANGALRLAVVFAGTLVVAAACTYHVDDYTLAPVDPCAGGCAACGTVANQEARASCLCGATDAGTCPTASSQELYTALADCVTQFCHVECGALIDAGTHLSTPTADCTACTQSQCLDPLKACVADDGGCPR